MPAGAINVGWEATRWWRVVDPDGKLWCETSDEKEARKCMRPGDTLWRMYQNVERKWEREES